MNGRDLSLAAVILRGPMRRLPFLIALLALPAFAPAAGAQVPDPDPPEVCCAPPDDAAPAPKPGKLTLSFRNGLRREGRLYLTKGQQVKIRGRARPFVVGQRVRINLRRDGRTVASKVRRLRKHGRRGQFVVRLLLHSDTLHRTRERTKSVQPPH